MKNIDSVFQELIALDPSFAKYEAEVRALIENLIKNKPEVHVDEDFVARLRSQLQGAPTPSPLSAFSLFSSHYVTLGVLVLLVAAPFGFYASTHRDSSAVFAMDQEINALPENAYGALQSADSGKGGAGETFVTNAVREPAPESMAVATAAAMPADAKVAAMSMTADSGAGSDARMMLPVGPITTYSYIYKGEPLELTQSEGAVYSHVKSQNSSGQVASQLRRFNFGLMDLGAYADAKVRSFELVQDKPYGYTIGVNFDEGQININPNYTQWPSLSGKESAPPALPLNAMLPREEILSIAKDFLETHGIRTANYAEPVVQEDQILAADSQMQYAPEQVSVIYPLKIQGSQVFEDGAYPYGLQVSVSIRDRRVISVYGLNSQTYSSSKYPLVTDTDKVLSVLGKGGPHAWVPDASSGVQVKKVEVEVGTPTKILMHTYNYKNGQSQELFVPALSFPVLKAPAVDEYYPKSIVVPLVPELLEDNQGGPVMYDLMR